MGKRKQKQKHSSTFPLNKRRKRDKKLKESDDRISELPDEVLALILSHLTLKEAARTSVLSHRWEKLWTLTASLDFYSDELQEEININCVNQVLEKHQTDVIDEFTVCFYLRCSKSSAIVDKWINFAIRKRVKKLNLDFRQRVKKINQYLSHPTKYFGWGEDHSLTGFRNLSSWISLNAVNPHLYHCNHLASHNSMASFNRLQALCLIKVDASQKVIEYILSNCQYLEQLRLSQLYKLKKLNIPGSLGHLKELEIRECCLLNKLEIWATALELFTYHGNKDSVSFNAAPPISSATLGGEFVIGFLKCAASREAFPLKHLNMLTLDFTELQYRHLWSSHVELVEFHTFTNLKQLELRIKTHPKRDLVWCMLLVLEFPFLQRLAIHLIPVQEDPEIMSKTERIVRESMICQKAIDSYHHKYLKEVEFIGFIGGDKDYILAFFFITWFRQIEVMTIDSRRIWYASDGTYIIFEDGSSTRGRERAKHLKNRLPDSAGAKLLIL